MYLVLTEIRKRIAHTLVIARIPFDLSSSTDLTWDWIMKKAMHLSKQIAKRKTLNGKRRAILRWCAELKRILS